MSYKRIGVWLGAIVLMFGALSFLLRSKPATETFSVRIMGPSVKLADGTYQWKLALTNLDFREHWLGIVYLEMKSANGIVTNRDVKDLMLNPLAANSGKELTISSANDMGAAARVSLVHGRTLTKVEKKTFPLLALVPFLYRQIAPKTKFATSEWFQVTAPVVPTAAKAVVATNGILDKSESIK